MILVYAGNRIDEPDRSEPRFPTANIGRIRQEVRRVFNETQPAWVVGAAAAGADLIVLSEAREAAIPAHIVLPLEVAEFRRASVADQDGDWVELFDHEVEHCERLTVRDLSAFDEWYLRGNDLILDVAAGMAVGDDDVVALAVKSPGDDNSATGDFHVKAIERNWPVVTIDPAVPDSSTSM